MLGFESELNENATHVVVSAQHWVEAASQMLILLKTSTFLIPSSFGSNHSSYIEKARAEEIVSRTAPKCSKPSSSMCEYP